ncbi:MAG: 4Fe-4S binding protein [Lachnospiraceae bacterium]|nr:4Fe-4S binding protein [Lachnospiraceae bacterium]
MRGGASSPHRIGKYLGDVGLFILSERPNKRLFSGNVPPKHSMYEKVLFWLFIGGNMLYYMVGIILAFAFKNNRAFCKYICPITVFLKPMSYYSILRIHRAKHGYHLRERLL